MGDTSQDRQRAPYRHTYRKIHRRFANIVQEHITVGKMRFCRRMEVSNTNTYEGTCMIMYPT